MPEVKVKLDKSDLDKAAAVEIARLEKEIKSLKRSKQTLKTKVDGLRIEIARNKEYCNRARAIIDAVKDAGEWYDTEYDPQWD